MKRSVLLLLSLCALGLADEPQSKTNSTEYTYYFDYLEKLHASDTNSFRWMTNTVTLEYIPFAYRESGISMLDLNKEGCISINVEAMVTVTNPFPRDYSKTPIVRFYTSTATNELSLQDVLKLLWKK